MRVKKFVKISTVMGVLALLLTACPTEVPSSEKVDVSAKNAAVDRIRKQLPIPSIDYAPVRRTIIDWNKRWDAPDKVSFIYLMADNGQFIGYYVARGLPVSYCVGLTPSDQIHIDRNGAAITRSAPDLDGVYYDGDDCNRYYFFDATTDAYIEFGGGIRFFIADQPLPVTVRPLGITTIDDVRDKIRKQATTP